jgi:flavin-binding protein dodecin
VFPQNLEGVVSVPVVRVLELVGTSDKDWSDAANQAVKEAAPKFPNIVGVEVLNWTANVKDGAITEYKADVKIAYLDDPK